MCLWPKILECVSVWHLKYFFRDCLFSLLRLPFGSVFLPFKLCLFAFWSCLFWPVSYFFLEAPLLKTSWGIFCSFACCCSTELLKQAHRNASPRFVAWLDIQQGNHDAHQHSCNSRYYLSVSNKELQGFFQSQMRYFYHNLLNISSQQALTLAEF